MARRRRWIWRILIGLLSLIVVVVISAFVLLANLDWGPLKRLVQSQARSAGVEIDYADGSAGWSGLNLRDVRVLSPPADADLAPTLVSIGSIDGSWSPLAKRIDDLVIRDVAVTLVQNPDGTTSLDRFLGGLPKSEPTPPVPLSQLLGSVLPRGVAARARIEGITLTILRRDGGEPTRLEGLTAAATLQGGALDAALGPTELRLTIGKKQAIVKLEAKVALGADGKLAAGVDATLVKQDLAPELPPVTKLAVLKLAVAPSAADKKTTVQLEKIALLDDAAVITGRAELRDGPAGSILPFVERADCRIDLVKLAKAVPPEFGPIEIDAEPIGCRVEKLDPGPPPTGALSVAGVIKRLVYRDIQATGIDLGVALKPNGMQLAFNLELAVASLAMPDLAVTGVTANVWGGRSQMAKATWPVHVEGKIEVASVKQPGQEVKGAKLKLNGDLLGPKQVDLNVAIDVDHLGGPALVDGTHLDVHVDKVTLADKALESTGKITVRGKIRRAAQLKGPRADDVDLTIDLGLGKPATVAVTANIKRLQVEGLPAGEAEIKVLAPRVVLNDADPKRSRGQAQITAAFAGGTVDVTVDGSAEAFTWDLTGKVDRFGPVRTVALASKGSYGARIEQNTTIDVGRVASGGAVLKSAKVGIVSSGTLRRQEATITAALDGVTLDGKALGSPRLELAATADLDRPRVDARLKGSAPDADLRIGVEIDKTRTIRWETEGRVAKLGTLAAFLPPGPAWNRVEVKLRGKGAASGVVRQVSGGVPVLVASPATTVRGRQNLDLEVRELHYRADEATTADFGVMSVKIDATLGDPHKANVLVEVPDLVGKASGVNLALAGLRAELDAQMSRRGAGKVDISVRAKSIKQSAFASYPVRDLDFTLAIARDAESAVKIRARLANPGAGTTLELDGELDERLLPAADAVPGRHSIGLTGRLEQALGGLDGAPEELRAKGRVIVPFRVESGDLSLFSAGARVKLDGVSVELPKAGIAISDVDGELPVRQEIVLGPDGPAPVGRGERGLYPQLRFADQAPFLGGSDYLSIGKVTAQGMKSSFGPVAGNVRLDRDVLAIDQLEMNALGGKIAGQTLVEVSGPDTRITFRGKVTGIQPTSGEERLDAHAALTMVPYRLGLEGRLEIVRISRPHLIDLLDIIDPYRADVSLNRVRLAMNVCYPKQVRLAFHQGFASLSIELGPGICPIKVEKREGIPIGPALQRFLAPVLEKP